MSDLCVQQRVLDFPDPRSHVFQNPPASCEGVYYSPFVHRIYSQLHTGWASSICKLLYTPLTLQN